MRHNIIIILYQGYMNYWCEQCIWIVTCISCTVPVVYYLNVRPVLIIVVVCVCQTNNVNSDCKIKTPICFCFFSLSGLIKCSCVYWQLLPPAGWQRHHGKYSFCVAYLTMSWFSGHVYSSTDRIICTVITETECGDDSAGSLITFVP